MFGLKTQLWTYPVRKIYFTGNIPVYCTPNYPDQFNVTFSTTLNADTNGSITWECQKDCLPCARTIITNTTQVFTYKEQESIP
jgi:hypothetical protein